MKALNIFQSIIWLSFLWLPQQLTAQESSMLLWKEAQHRLILSSPEQAKRTALESGEEVAFSQILELNPQFIPAKELDIALSGEQFQVEQTRIKWHSTNHYSWFGNNEDHSIQLHFNRWNSRFNGVLRAFGNTYELHHIGNGKLLCIQYHHQESIGCETPDHLEDALQETPNKQADEGENALPQVQERSQSECRLRVLVGFTTQATNSVGDTYGFAQSCIDDLNINFSNSGVSHRAELARVIQFDYDESTDGNNLITTYLDHFSEVDPSTYHMDQVFSDRSITDADICVLIFKSAGTSTGRAKAIGADYSSAFCAVKRTVAIGNLTFSHEVGHLYGCRHDPYMDSNTTPFEYGHGMVNVAENWRTIMSYDDECTDNSSYCDRISYFSNIGIKHPQTGSDLGDETLRDNARALNDAAGTAMGFESIPDLKTLRINRTVKAYEFLNIQARSRLTLDGATITFQKNSKGTLNAQESFLLKNHARIIVEDDTIGRVILKPTDACQGNSRQSPIVQSDTPKAPKGIFSLNKRLPALLEVSPNPFHRATQVRYKSRETGTSTVIFRFFNQYGQLIQERRTLKPLKGDIQFSWKPPHQRGQQMIFLSVLDGASRSSHKLVFNP